MGGAKKSERVVGAASNHGLALSAGAAFLCRSYGADRSFPGQNYTDWAPTEPAEGTQKMWVMLRQQRRTPRTHAPCRAYAAVDRHAGQRQFIELRWRQPSAQWEARALRFAPSCHRAGY